MSGAAPGTDSEMRITIIEESDISPILSALNDEFGDGFDRVWFDWKHSSNPSGPSTGWVARDEEGLLGVRLLLRWQFKSSSCSVTALRPCDTVTVPRARGKGVFRALTVHAIEKSRSEADLMFNTPNDQSRPGYLKMGFSVWAKVRQSVRPIKHSRAAIDNVIDGRNPPAELATDLTASFIDWRYRQCPGYDYAFHRLAESDTPSGIITRVKTVKGVRMLIVEEIWGEDTATRVLLGAVGREQRAHLAWVIGSERRENFEMSRSSTTVTTLPLRETPDLIPVFSVGDIESVL